MPILLASGDDHAMEEIGLLIEGVHSVVLKWFYGTKSSRMISPALSHARIREGVKQALANPAGKPFVVEPPIELDIASVGGFGRAPTYYQAFPTSHGSINLGAIVWQQGSTAD